MKKEKGFTLIELLAVIVILAVLMVVAVPKILNVINKTKESAAESSVKLVKDAIKTQLASQELTDNKFEQDEDGCYTFDFSNQKSGNAKKLNVKNKDQITGSIKYCSGKFKDDKINKAVICKRATTLHTEECKWTYDYCKSGGYSSSGSKGTTTITYGNLGTTGVLTSGDAFDCDVNGDGVYDASTERFYYVSDYYNTNTKSFEDDTAVLIYYNNVSSGQPATVTYAYDSSNENFHGPRSLIAQLPTTGNWKNVSLKNSTRAILNENGGNTSGGGKNELERNFSYNGYAARLLSISEVIRSCSPNEKFWTNTVGGIGDNCYYLFENTRFSSSDKKEYWLESTSYVDSSAWYVRADVHGVYNISVSSDYFAVRPVIEVSKTDIEY